MSAPLDLIRGRWVAGSDKEPDATIYHDNESADDDVWRWEAGGQSGAARDLEGAKLATELAHYKARCDEMRQELCGILHDLENATQALRALLGRTP